ncbi:MAG: hypothetical protein M1830_006260 [Pleopsidium flavum]|nr:MAG: hypothetical protein M1830_006260 [Pleopsidium flavum]
MVINDLKLIQAAGWICDRFALTDVDNRNWESEYYGTTTLIDKRLPIDKVFRVHYETGRERDGLFVLCNTHLESLEAEARLRPSQVAAVARQLHSPEAYAGILAGNCNAIQPFHRTLQIENDLKDAYLELGGQEDGEGGYTWGHQVPRETR